MTGPTDGEHRPTWEDHQREQRRRWRQLSFEERLRWLEQAKDFAARAEGAARTAPRRSPDRVPGL